MLTKVLAVVFAVAIPAVGGTVYLAAGGKCPFSCSEQTACPATASVSEETPNCCQMPSCCQTPSRTSCANGEGVSCCGDHETEVLDVMPREVK
jgi:hypothetical protein